MRYMVHVKEISYGFIELEADSAEQAKELANRQYAKGNTNWQSGEYELTTEEVKPLQRNDEAR